MAAAAAAAVRQGSYPCDQQARSMPLHCLLLTTSLGRPRSAGGTSLRRLLARCQGLAAHSAQADCAHARAWSVVGMREGQNPSNSSAWAPPLAYAEPSAAAAAETAISPLQQQVDPRYRAMQWKQALRFHALDSVAARIRYDA